MRAAVRYAQYDAIVIGRRNWREADRIVDLLTAESGRCCAVARAARGSRHRFQGNLELFSGLRVQLDERRPLWQLLSAQVLQSRMGLRGDFAAIEQASVLVDSVKALTPEGQVATPTFAALSAALEKLDQGDVAASAQAWPHLFRAAGIYPDLSVCGRCGRRDPGRYGYDRHVLVLCETCGGRQPIIESRALAVLRGGACDDLEVARRVGEICVFWVEAHVGRPLLSTRYRSTPAMTGERAC